MITQEYIYRQLLNLGLLLGFWLFWTLCAIIYIIAREIEQFKLQKFLNEHQLNDRYQKYLENWKKPIKKVKKDG